MFKKIVLCILFFVFSTMSASAVDNIVDPSQLDQIGLNYPTELFKDEALQIDLTNLKNDLSLYYPDENFVYEWDIRGAASRQGDSLELTFQEIGEKYIDLKVFRESGELLFNKELEIIVYEKSTPLYIQKSFLNRNLQRFRSIAGEEGIYFYVSEIEKQRIEDANILSMIENYRRIEGPKSDYITIWGDREFVASFISKLGSELSTNNSSMQFKILTISPYNLGLLENYLKNFIVEKPWLQKIILVNEDAKFQTHIAPQSIELLQQNLETNGFEHVNINIEESGINQFLFISKFINNLSNSGYTSDGIYLIILIPFLFTLLVMVKHLVGLSPIGILVPIGFTIMIFKIGVLASVIFFILFVFINVILARAINTQTLLYTPKISFLLIINIIFAILLINLFTAYGIIDLSLGNSLFMIIYIIILEKLVNVILSKEFNEYRPALMNSIFIGLLGYVIFSSETITTIILSYPEMILALMPLNFFIGKFSGLRVTEYFRFREVIKTVEEEE